MVQILISQKDLCKQNISEIGRPCPTREPVQRPWIIKNVLDSHEYVCGAINQLQMAYVPDQQLSLVD